VRWLLLFLQPLLLLGVLLRQLLRVLPLQLLLFRVVSLLLCQPLMVHLLLRIFDHLDEFVCYIPAIMRRVANEPGLRELAA
jgi:hypothetical protein